MLNKHHIIFPKYIHVIIRKSVRGSVSVLCWLLKKNNFPYNGSLVQHCVDEKTAVVIARGTSYPETSGRTIVYQSVTSIKACLIKWNKLEKGRNSGFGKKRPGLSGLMLVCHV